MSTLARTDKSLFGRWWWTVDRWMLIAIVAIAAIGAVLTLAASPAVAERIADEELSLPMFPELAEEQVKDVATALEQAVTA